MNNGRFPYHFFTGKLSLLLLLTMLLCFTAQSQVDEEISIVKAYKPELTKAVKMDAQPREPKLSLETPDLKYQAEPVFYNLKPDKSPLPGVSLGQQELRPLRYSHFKLGGGNFANFFGEATYNTKRSKDQSLAAFARHHSGRGPVENSEFSEQALRLKGKKLFDHATLTANPFFQRNRIHRYGYLSDTSFSQSQVQQDYIRYGLKAAIANDRGDSGSLNYKAKVNFQDLRTGSDVGESDLMVDGHVVEPINKNAARIDARYRFLDYRTERGSFQRNVIKFGGRYVFRNLEKGSIAVGFKTASVVDTNDNTFKFYPNVRVQYPLIPDTLTLFGGITGNLQPNTYGGLTRENPYLRPDVALLNTNEQFNMFAGVKGRIGDKVDYLARLAYLNIENMPLYVNSQLAQQRFRMQYDTAIATVFRLKTEFRYQPVNHFQVGLKLRFQNFNMGREAEPWHKPSLDYRITGRYNFGKKIRLRASIQGYGQRSALTYDTDTDADATGKKTLDAIFDLNTGVDYRFSKTITAFFNFRNLLGTEYQYWNQYPVRGFHVTGGLKMNLFQ